MGWQEKIKTSKVQNTTTTSVKTTKENGDKKNSFGDNIGYLYESKTKNGDKCFYGRVNGQKIAVFLNKFKTAENTQPDFQIVEDLRPDKSSTGAEPKAKGATWSTPSDRPATIEKEYTDDDFVEDDGLPDF